MIRVIRMNITIELPDELIQPARRMARPEVSSLRAPVEGRVYRAALRLAGRQCAAG
jgi:hypothetical protein